MHKKMREVQDRCNALSERISQLKRLIKIQKGDALKASKEELASKVIQLEQANPLSVLVKAGYSPLDIAIEYAYVCRTEQPAALPAVGTPDPVAAEAATQDFLFGKFDSFLTATQEISVR